MTDSAAHPAKASSSTRTIAIVIIVVLIVAGGAFVIYKLTNKKDVGLPAYGVANAVVRGVTSGDQAAVDKNTTAKGRASVALLKGKLSGLKLSGCIPAPDVGGAKTKLCTFSRPGGQLSVALTRPKDVWLVSAAVLGPAGLPPTTTTPTT